MSHSDGTEEGVAGGTAGRGGSASSDAFISYASPDTSLANALCHALERGGLRCWIAPRDVNPGSLYADEIIRAINGARVLVVVLSESATLSPHVGKEIERAASKRRPLVTLRTDAAALTPALEYFLSDSQWIDLRTEGTEAAFDRVATAARQRGGAPVVPRPASPEQPPAERAAPDARRYWTRVGQAVVVLAALATFALKVWMWRHVPPPAAVLAAEGTGTAGDPTPSELAGPNGEAIRAWLTNHPRYRLAAAGDCACEEQLRLIRQGDVNRAPQPHYQPYAARGDFDGDGVEDLAVTAIPRQGTGGALVLVALGGGTGAAEILEIVQQGAGVAGRGLSVAAPARGESRARLLFGAFGSEAQQVPVR